MYYGSPRRRRTGGVASPRRVHDHHQQLGRVDQRALQNTESHCRPEMQGHGRTADVPRDIYLRKLPRIDVAANCSIISRSRERTLIGYSMGGAVAMQCAIRHPDKVRRAVIISSTFRSDGMIAEALEAIPKLTADAFKGSPIEAEYKKLSPTPDEFPNFVQ